MLILPGVAVGVLLGTVGAAVVLAVDDEAAGEDTPAILSAIRRPIHSLCDAENSLSARGSSFVGSVVDMVPVVMQLCCLGGSWFVNAFVQTELRHVLTGSGAHVPIFDPAPSIARARARVPWLLV